MLEVEFLVPGMGTSGRTNGMSPLCLGESVTPKGWEGLTEFCADGKPMQIFGCYEIDREMIGLKKNSEEPTAFKLVFRRHNIRFRPTRREGVMGTWLMLPQFNS